MLKDEVFMKSEKISESGDARIRLIRQGKKFGTRRPEKFIAEVFETSIMSP